MESLSYCGSTSDFFRNETGYVIKLPMKIWAGNPNREKLEEERRQAIAFERRVLEKLGAHPRVVPYMGAYAQGILLVEANHGNLQQYLDSNRAIDDSLRLKWSLQAVEAVAYIHSKGVIHSDLRPENFLVHGTDERSLNLWICDFGGARCDEIGPNVPHLPDDAFFDPRLPWEPTTAVDIFSLGSVIFTILTGCWPYRDGPPPEDAEDKEAYGKHVDDMFAASTFPDVSKLRGGSVIMGCWNHQCKTAEEVLLVMNLEMVDK